VNTLNRSMIGTGAVNRSFLNKSTNEISCINNRSEVGSEEGHDYSQYMGGQTNKMINIEESKNERGASSISPLTKDKQLISSTFDHAVKRVKAKGYAENDKSSYQMSSSRTPRGGRDNN
jgi:hypothetical protein